MVDFAGFNMPVSYPSGVNSECSSVRSNAGLFDVSHMGQILIEGDGSFEFIQYLTTNDVSKIKNGQCQYTLLCNEDGGIIDDLILYRIEENKFLLVVNASNIDKDCKWIEGRLKYLINLPIGSSDLTSTLTWSSIVVENLSSDISLIALQGPESRNILSNFKEFKDYVNDLNFYHFVDLSDREELRIISRTGYTGELGYEIYGSSQFIGYIWDRLVDEFNVPPIGLAARDILRLEMCYRLYGNDMNDEISPYECGLGWVVQASKDLASRELPTRFIGREAVVDKKRTAHQRIVYLEMKDRCIPRKGYRLISGDIDVGYISSGTFSPNLKKGIAMAFVDINKTKDCDIYVKIREKLFLTNIVENSFIKETSLFE